MARNMLMPHEDVGARSEIVSLYFGGVGWSHPIQEVRDRQIAEVQKDLDRVFLKADTIYEVTLTQYQNPFIGPLVEKLGFKHVHTSQNPNTRNIIYTYIRSPFPIE